MISFAAVFQSVTTHGSVRKPRCAIELLLLLREPIVRRRVPAFLQLVPTELFLFVFRLQKHVTCTGSAEECASLAQSLLQLQLWLLTMTSEALAALTGGGGGVNGRELTTLLDHAAELLDELHTDEFLLSLLYIGGCRDEAGRTRVPQLCDRVAAEVQRWSAGADSSDVELARRITATIGYLSLAPLSQRNPGLPGFTEFPKYELIRERLISIDWVVSDDRPARQSRTVASISSAVTVE